MDANSDVDGWLSADQIVALSPPGYPRSARRIHDRALAESWETRLIPSQGRTGNKRVYRLPSAVVDLVRRAHLQAAFDAYRTHVAAGEPLSTAKANFINDYNAKASSVDAVDGIEKLTVEQLNEALSLKGLIPHATGSGKSSAAVSLYEAALAIEGGAQVVEQPVASYDSRRDLLEAVLRVGEYKILHNQVTNPIIEFGLEGAPSWLESARDFPDLELRLRNMIATFKFLSAANQK